MIKSKFLSFALVACAMAMSAVAWAVQPLASAFGFVRRHAREAFKLAKSTETFKDVRPMWFIKPRAFVALLQKRDRPVVTSSWRMCPSA